MGFPVRECGEFPIRSHTILYRIFDRNFPIVCYFFLWKMAWSVEIQIWYEMISIEEIDPRSKYSFNMPVSELLSDNSSILTLDKSVIRRMPWSALCLRNSELFEERCYTIVDEFTSVIRVEVSNNKWKGFKCLFEERKQESFRYFFNRKGYFPLSHFVCKIDMVHPFFSVQVSLMYGVDSDESGDSSRIRFLAYSNRNIYAPSLGYHERFFPITTGRSQAIQLCDRDIFESSKASISSRIFIMHQGNSNTSGESSCGIIYFCE